MKKIKCHVSIIIPFHSGSNFIIGCLNSLINTVPKNTEIIVVGKVSSNNLDLSCFENIKILDIEKELTYPQAINLGSEHAEGEYLIFCDADTFLTKGWFENLTSFYYSNPKIGIASSKLINPYSNRVLDFGIAFTKYNSPHIGRDRYLDFKTVSFNRKVQAACSANMIIRKSLFLQVNGFNTDLPYSYCDIDLCLRLKKLYLDTWVVSNSIVFHKGDSTKINLGLYKNEVKSRFWALNNDQIEIDMGKYFIENFYYFQSQNSISKSYFLVDMSTVIDREWHHQIFSNELQLNLADRFIIPTSDRDTSHISLYGFLDWNILKLRYPIVYFVDRYISIMENTLWWNIRANSHDIVIDRNGNINSIGDK